MHQAFGRLALSLPSAFSSSFDGNCSRSSRAIFESWSAAFFLLPLKVFCAHSDSSLATTKPCALVVVRVYFTSSGIVKMKNSQPYARCAHALRALAQPQVEVVAWSGKGGEVVVCAPSCVPASAYYTKN